MSPDQNQGFSGRTRSTLSEVIAGLSHSTIDNLYVRFEVEDQRLPAREKPDKLKKATRLVDAINRSTQTRRADLRELLRYIIEDVHGGDLTKDWQRLRDLRGALEDDGYRVTDGRLATVTPHRGGGSRRTQHIQNGERQEPSLASKDRRTVFLVHGRDASVRESLIALLRAFDLRVVTWRDAASAAGGGTPYTGDIVRAGMDLAHAVVVLLTPDDVGYVRRTFRDPQDGRDELEPTGQARLNVIFEAGMAMALGRDRVVIIEVGRVRAMSDTAGLNVIRLHDNVERRKDLAARLKSAGLAVDDTGEEWRTAGVFDHLEPLAEELLPSFTSSTREVPGSVGVTEAEHLVLAHLDYHFSKPGTHRLDTPFDVAGMDWPQVEVVLRDLADSVPPYIRGVSVNQADYPVVITGLTERGRSAARSIRRT